MTLNDYYILSVLYFCSILFYQFEKFIFNIYSWWFISMDRCRCEDYKAAVEKLKFYTVGTFRPDIIDGYDRSGFVTTWVKHGIDYEDLKFSKARATKVYQHHELAENRLTPQSRKIEQMWCDYMTPVKK